MKRLAFLALLVIACAASSSAAEIPSTGTSEVLMTASATPSDTGRRQNGTPHERLGSPSQPAVAARSQPSGAPESVLASPTGEVGTALLGGFATWHDACSTCAAAGPALRHALGAGWRGTVLDIGGPGNAVVRVVLTDSCACRDRHDLPTLIDLSAEAFAELAPLDWGVVAVSIEIPAQLPSTDSEDTP